MISLLSKIPLIIMNVLFMVFILSLIAQTSFILAFDKFGDKHVALYFSFAMAFVSFVYIRFNHKINIYLATKTDNLS